MADTSAPEVRITRGPNATDEEMAAIMAAVQVALASGGPAAAPTPDAAPRWRFSGRWWSKPVPSRRDRPSAG
jgi:hypothetical protein